MRTDHLLDLWGLDTEGLVRSAHQRFGECDVFLGGSLADDLGSPNSDVDLYCFLPPDNPRRRPEMATAEGTTIEFHPVAVDDYRDFSHSLASLLAVTPPAELVLPLPTGEDLRRMHTLWRDRALRPGRFADTIRTATGADILHVYVAVRAITSASTLVYDVSDHRDAGDGWAALHCARLAAEAGCDAAMALSGFYNPNAKWRISLLRRALLARLTRWDEPTLLQALFPPPQPDLAIGQCLRMVRDALSVVREDALVRTFPAVAALEKALEQLPSEWTARD